MKVPMNPDGLVRILKVACLIASLLVAGVIGAIVDRVIVNHKLDTVIKDMQKASQ